jgi:hypothetical protein
VKAPGTPTRMYFPVVGSSTTSSGLFSQRELTFGTSEPTERVILFEDEEKSLLLRVLKLGVLKSVGDVVE